MYYKEEIKRKMSFYWIPKDDVSSVVGYQLGIINRNEAFLNKWRQCVDTLPSDKSITHEIPYVKIL